MCWWFLLSIAFSAEPEPNWPGFLGGGALPRLDQNSLPLSWSPTSFAGWSANLPGFGQSSPVVWGGQVYVTSVDGPLKDRLLVTCLSLADGRELWRQEFPNSDPVENGTFVSRAAPTPVADATGVYCFFEGGDLIALTHQGEVRWNWSLSERFGKFDNKYGLAASPLLDEHGIYLLIDHFGPSYAIAVDKQTGDVRWTTERKSRGSWSSPAWLPVQGGRQILCSSAGSIDAYDPQSGTLLWSFAEIGGNRICTPWIFGEGQFLVGSQTSREFPDVDSIKKSNLAMRVSQHDGHWIPEVLWRTEDATPAMASPMVHQGRAYWINRTGAVFCFNALTGEPLYQGRISQMCWATPLGVGDRLYCFGKDGATTVLSAGDSFEILAENELWDAEATPVDQAIIDQETDPVRKRAAAMHAKPEVHAVIATPGRILLRTGTVLYCRTSAKDQ